MFSQKVAQQSLRRRMFSSLDFCDSSGSLMLTIHFRSSCRPAAVRHAVCEDARLPGRRCSWKGCADEVGLPNSRLQALENIILSRIGATPQIDVIHHRTKLTRTTQTRHLVPEHRRPNPDPG